MTISTSFQAYSVTALRLSITPTPAPVAAASVSARPAQDRVSLSSGAASSSLEPTGAEPAGQTPGGPAIAPTGPSGKGAALFAALDADKDGAITKQEFTDAAASLLRRDAPSKANDEGRGRRGLPGLERRLEKAFDRIDGNDDGSLDAAELATALEGRRQRDDDKGGDAAPVPQGATITVSFVRVTAVSIAVQRYSALEPPAPTALPTTPAATTISNEPAPTPAAA